jgi:putative tricarboxylic transport membrane protein
VAAGASRPRPGPSRGLALPLAGLLVGAVYTAGTLWYPIGTPVAPGPGLFPLLAGLTMTVASAIALIAECRAPSIVLSEPGESFRRVPMLVAALLGYAIVLRPAGFLAASATLVALALVILGRRRASTVVAIAVALSAACYLTFRLLGVPLPLGALGLG